MMADAHFPLCGTEENGSDVTCAVCIARISNIEVLGKFVRAVTAADEQQRNVIVSVQLDGTLRIWCLTCRWEVPHLSGVTMFALRHAALHSCDEHKRL